VFTPNLQMDMSSLFENFPIDELFKELQWERYIEG
jgi:hypothetical protein